MGLLERLRGFTNTHVEDEAEQLQDLSILEGGDDLTALAPRHAACVVGVIRSVTLPARQNVPTLVAELWDGKGAVNLVWIGRRRIGGIEPGAYLKARGRVSAVRGIPTIFNPAYELIPQS